MIAVQLTPKQPLYVPFLQPLLLHKRREMLLLLELRLLLLLGLYDVRMMRRLRHSVHMCLRLTLCMHQRALVLVLARARAARVLPARGRDDVCRLRHAPARALHDG